MPKPSLWKRLGLSGVALILPAIFTACAEGDQAATAEQRPADKIPADRAGLFELADSRYPFLVVRCDLTGSAEDGMLVRGSGTTPDGRRMAVEVERQTDGNGVSERASVFFGNLNQRDSWSARRRGNGKGAWFRDEAGIEPADGPLLKVAGTQLIASGQFQHGSKDSAQPGTLRAACPAEKNQ